MGASTVKVVLLGDIVGKPGRRIIADKLPALKTDLEAEFCIANCENAAGGSGVTPEIVEELLRAGADVLTSGDHVWKRKEIIPYFAENPRILRPANYGDAAAGAGAGVFDLPGGEKIGVLNLVGRVFMNPADCPFKAADEEINRIKTQTNIIFVDMHCEATSEKVAMGWYLDGRVSAVFGTHTHVQTADERILPNGTAYITDLGMTGPCDSILGRRKDRVLQAILTQMPTAFDVAKGDVRMCGAVVTVDRKTGLALEIERLTVTSE